MKNIRKTDLSLPEPATDEQAHATPAALVTPDQVRDADGEGRMAVRKRERYVAVQALVVAGHSLNAISRQMGLCFRTVQRYAQADSLEELLATAQRSSTLDRFKEYLLTRWNDGCTDAGRLHRELQGMGMARQCQDGAPLHPATSRGDQYAATKTGHAQATQGRQMAHDQPSQPDSRRRGPPERDHGPLPGTGGHPPPCRRVRLHDARTARRPTPQLDGCGHRG